MAREYTFDIKEQDESKSYLSKHKSQLNLFKNLALLSIGLSTFKYQLMLGSDCAPAKEYNPIVFILNYVWILMIPAMLVASMLLISRFIEPKLGLKYILLFLYGLNILCEIGISTPKIGFICKTTFLKNIFYPRLDF